MKEPLNFEQKQLLEKIKNESNIIDLHKLRENLFHKEYEKLILKEKLAQLPEVLVKMKGF